MKRMKEEKYFYQTPFGINSSKRAGGDTFSYLSLSFSLTHSLLFTENASNTLFTHTHVSYSFSKVERGKKRKKEAGGDEGG